MPGLRGPLLPTFFPSNPPLTSPPWAKWFALNCLSHCHKATLVFFYFYFFTVHKFLSGSPGTVEQPEWVEWKCSNRASSMSLSMCSDGFAHAESVHSLFFLRLDHAKAALMESVCVFSCVFVTTPLQALLLSICSSVSAQELQNKIYSCFCFSGCLDSTAASSFSCSSGIIETVNDPQPSPW